MNVRTEIHKICGAGIVILCLALCWVACTDDLGLVGNRPSEVVCFTATLTENGHSTSTRSTSGCLSIEEEEWCLNGLDGFSSRGTLVTALDKMTAGVIGPFETDKALTNVPFSFSGDELSSASPIYWKDMPAQAMEIYAYAPKEITNATIITDTKSITYSVPIDVTKQTDIIAAYKNVGTNEFRQSVPLTFEHILTAIRFKMGFECKVKSIQVTNVYNKGTYIIGGAWTIDTNSTSDYTVSFDDGKGVAKNGMLVDGANTLLLMPQDFDASSQAQVMLTYQVGDVEKTITASLANQKWKPGKLITYTLYEGEEPGYIYFDLAAGNVEITATGYSGKIYLNGEVKPVKGTHVATNRYYVYQSTQDNKSKTGYANENDYNKKNNCRIPDYDPVEYDNKLWSDYITNNSCVENVIEGWVEAIKTVNREACSNYISVKGDLKCMLTINNVYSNKQGTSNTSTEEGMVFNPPQSENADAQLTLEILGDNRLGNIYYVNSYNNKNQLIFQGTGSLTVAAVDGVQGTKYSECGYGYTANWWRGVIGSNDSDGGPDNSYGIVINSGVIFAGSTKAENATAIGGGGNGEATVTINGGVVTAVATTTGAAIGGGMAISAEGGGGDVFIHGGNVYAYNFENGYKIPSAAIGGGGSKQKKGNYGNVTITGGNVYAYSVGGTAIGGGSSETNEGGSSTVHITGGNVIAISAPGENMPAGAGIGGGTGGNISGSNGGNATVRISGNPIIRTGSIGGGKTNNSAGTIGSADIEIRGGDIQAQFVMAAGSNIKPKFYMYDGTIRNSNTKDNEYIHIQKNGSAVYLEDGNFTMEGGKILNCMAVTEEGVVSGYGGAVYIKGTNNPTFTMKAGEISNCTSDADGGAIYLEGGTVTLSGGSISQNLAEGGNGGGIYIKEGSFSMTDNSTASIIRNSAIFRDKKGGKGGGLYITSDSKNVSVNVLSGTIKENTSDRFGGGICVEMLLNSSVAANVEVGINDTTGPDISYNHTLQSGGGLYVSGQQSNITINGGNIMGNTTSAYVSNEDVANEGGMVTLNGGNVNHKVVTFYRNDGSSGSETQNIVTATNSILVVPGFTRTGYKLTGWNTRADGKGVSYTNGQTMNISADMALYAQWQLQQ